MTTPMANIEMARAWDGEEGEDWTTNADRYEASSERVWAHLEAAAALEPTDRVLDIGCGTGRSTLNAARVASSGTALGVDLSSRMLAYARERARDEGIENVEFLRADAQVHPFEAACFDVGISLFGAMFFNDGAAAFANIHQALRPGGHLALLTWQPLEENEWLTTIRGALAMGRTLPAPPLGAPGPFGLADRDRVHALLGGVRFVDVSVTPVNEPIYLGADADDAWTFVRGMGIVRGLTRDLDEGTKQEALARLRDVIASHEGPDGVLLGSAAWLVEARRP